MRANDPIVTFLLVLAIGIVAGVLFDRVAGLGARRDVKVSVTALGDGQVACI